MGMVNLLSTSSDPIRERVVLFTSKCVSLQKDDRQQKSHLLLPETAHTRSNKALEPTFKSFSRVNGLWHWDCDNFKVGTDVVEGSQCIMMYIVVACHLEAIFGMKHMM